MSFTTEEIFQIVNTGKTPSIHLENFPNIPSKWKNEKLSKKWDKLKIPRNVVNAAIEIKRSNKEVGSSLEADVQVYLDDDYLKLCSGIDLSELFITSKAEAKPKNKNENFFKIEGVDNINVKVKKAAGHKCPRCWKIVEDTCDRCDKATKNNHDAKE